MLGFLIIGLWWLYEALHERGARAGRRRLPMK